MTGHNHYSNCTCGWCVGGGHGGHMASIAVRAEPHKLERNLLRDYFVTERRQAACLVNPNAHCPVCGASVYFYQNVFGSRVFFDDLGGDWPKHGCTDTRPNKISSNRVTPDVFNSATRTRRLAQAAGSVGFAVRGISGRSKNGIGSILVRVTEVWSVPCLKIILGICISDSENQIIFSCDDPSDMIEVDDIVDVHRDVVSILNPDTFNREELPLVSALRVHNTLI